MTRYVFQEVSIKAVFRWTDAAGKKRQETRKFFQTINPFNKNAAGQPKGQQEILAELKRERDLRLLKRENDQREGVSA